MDRTATALPAPPGPRPVAPLLPVPALQRLAVQLGELIDDLSRTRSRHEEAFPAVTDDRFAGEAADSFRSALAGQLRRAGALRTALTHDLDDVHHLLARARAMQQRYEDAVRSWELRRDRYHEEVLALGRGPVVVPEPHPADWARRRGAGP
jgi:hypothetical protein